MFEITLLMEKINRRTKRLDYEEDRHQSGRGPLMRQWCGGVMSENAQVKLVALNVPFPLPGCGIGS